MVFNDLLTSTREHLRDRRGLFALFGIYVGILISLALFVMTSVATIKQVAITFATVAVFPALFLLLVAVCLGRNNSGAPRNTILGLWWRLAAASLPAILLAVIAFQLFGNFEAWWSGSSTDDSVVFMIIRVAVFALGVPLAIIQLWVATANHGLPKTGAEFKRMLRGAFGLRPLLTYVLGIAISLALAYALFKLRLPFQQTGAQIASMLVRGILGMVVVFFGLIVTLTALRRAMSNTGATNRAQ